jgi:hypothetical protein
VSRLLNLMFLSTLLTAAGTGAAAYILVDRGADVGLLIVTVVLALLAGANILGLALVLRKEM